MGCMSTNVLASAAATLAVLTQQQQPASAFLVAPSTRAVGPASAAAVGAAAASIPRRWQHRLRPRNWMCEGSNNVVPATTRRDMVQVAGASIAAAATVGLADPSTAGAATAIAAPMTISGGVVTESDRRGVEQTTIRWKDTVTMGTPDAPRKTANLYALDGVLWGTVSEEVRDTPEEIYDYFDYFARLPKLRLSEFTPVSVRVYGDFATQAGTYTFAWSGEDGAPKEKRARFSFTFRRDPESPTAWTIVEHHSSSMPTSPAQLKHVIHNGGDVF
ncbi:unnamed protein product [Scytosiphon promiscuus]